MIKVRENSRTKYKVGERNSPSPSCQERECGEVEGVQPQIAMPLRTKKSTMSLSTTLTKWLISVNFIISQPQVELAKLKSLSLKMVKDDNNG